MLVAVLTGDVINSTQNTQFLNKLQQILKDVSKQYKLHESSVEVYRGDSFQCMLEHPEDALMLAMLIRAGLKSTGYYKKFRKSFDAKVAIGIGTVRKKGKKPGESIGEAFVSSGRKLDELQDKKYNMALKMNLEELDPLADTMVRFIDDIIVNWSAVSADTACHYWFDGLNQEQLAEKLGISQPAVNKRLWTAKMQLLENADKNFRTTIKNLHNGRTTSSV